MLAINWDEVKQGIKDDNSGLQVCNKILLPQTPAVSIVPGTGKLLSVATTVIGMTGSRMLSILFN